MVLVTAASILQRNLFVSCCCSTDQTHRYMFVADVQVQCCFTSTETIRTVRDGEPRTVSSTFTQPRSSVLTCSVQCCFTSTETIRTIRDQETRTSTSTFTQLLSSYTNGEVWWSLCTLYSPACQVSVTVGDSGLLPLC